jgi:predicted esterase
MRRAAAILVVSTITSILMASTVAQEVPAKDITIAGQSKQRYFLIGDTKAKAREAGFGLVLVMPGGDGSIDFQPFVKNIQANALPEGYLVAQLIAVPSKNENQIVWPTAQFKDPKQTFTTESFIANVVSDVKDKQKVKVDPKRVFTLAWSSGGPAAYAASLAKDTPVTGSFIAMSVFHLQQLKSSLPAAKGKPYFLLQSPQDQVTAFFFLNLAKTQLTNAGATVEVAKYDGGHGWQGDAFGKIRPGIQWLEKQVAENEKK